MAETSLIRQFLVGIGFKVDVDSQKKFKDGVEDATKQTDKLDQAQVKAGKSAVKMAAAIAGTGVWLTSRVTDFAAKLEQLHFAARRTNSAASSLKAVANAAQDVGVSSDEALGSVENVARFMRNNPGGESYIQSLGVQTRDANGHLRDTVDIVNDLGKSLSKQPQWLSQQYADNLGISENFMLGMRDKSYFSSYDRAKQDYDKSGVDKSNDYAHSLMNRLRHLQSGAEGTFGTVGTFGLETGATLGGGILSYYAAKGIVQQAIGKALGKGAATAAEGAAKAAATEAGEAAASAAGKAATTAAESAAKTAATQAGKAATTAAEAAAKTAATQAGESAAAAAAETSASAAGKAAGWFSRALPWAGRLLGGVGLMLHSESLNEGEDEYLAKRREAGKPPTFTVQTEAPTPTPTPTPAQTPPPPPPPVDTERAAAPVASGDAAVANAPLGSGLADRIANSAFGRLISRGEGDYNSVNRGARGGYRAGTENLEGMTLAQVMAAQRAGTFNAAGRYQIVRDTLSEAARAMNLNGSERFDRKLQDRIFGDYLVSKKRHAIGDYLTGKSSNMHAAMLAAAREWASVASPDTGRSYYDGVGNNRASITIAQMESALRNTRSTYQASPDLLAAVNARGPAKVEINQDIKIQVAGNSDPVSTARSVAREQQGVNDSIVRNLQGVVG